MSQMEPLDHKRPDIYFFSLKPNMYKRKFLYRGQSDHYEGFPCVPNLFRNPEQNAKRDFLDPLIFSQEMELLIKSHPIVQMLEQGIELLHDKFRIRMHYIGIAQHYYNKTPYLDLTSNLEVAKFFATTNYDATHDCYTPNTDTSRTGVIYYYELKYPDAFQQHHIYTSRTFGKQMFQTSEYALKTIGKQVFLRSGLQNGFLLEMEQEVDFKTLPEVKAVYFKHNVDISEEIFRKSGQGKKYFAEDILQHAWHDRLKERYQNRVVSREAVRLNVSRNKGETEKTIIAKLKDRGIEVDNYVPKFSEEELSSFYQDIDQWWEDFCSDIHFGDAEDELYRETMKQLRHDPKYSKYFTFNK
ncbi:FRG domain-containing protein [Hoylesella shahii]|nr:FRG domain-containing protein [Hoylesella shahii]